jgi:thymidylate kinase
VPDVALLFELPVAEGLARAAARGGAPEPGFERADYLERVAAIFAAIERRWIVRVDASGDVEQVSARALGALHDALQEEPGGLDD